MKEKGKEGEGMRETGKAGVGGVRGRREGGKEEARKGGMEQRRKEGIKLNERKTHTVSYARKYGVKGMPLYKVDIAHRSPQ